MPNLNAPWLQPFIGPRGLLHPLWAAFIRDLIAAIGVTPIVIGSVALPDQSASIPQTAIVATGLKNGVITEGFYRFGYYAQVTTPGTISSSLQVTVKWTYGGQVQTFTGALLNGNTLTTQESVGPKIVAIDANTEVTYAVAYATAGATPMEYSFAVFLEQVPEAPSA